jgi:oligopeptide transport system ATP-binding protein
MEYSDEYVLQVRDMSVEFHTPAGVVRAVNDISFDLKRGEILGIVGESGSGKSATAKALMRLLPKSASVTGDIRLLGHDIQSVRKKEFNKVRGKDVAMIFQDPMTSLNPVYTVGNQLMEPLKLHMHMSTAEARRRSIELLELVSIPQPELRLKQYPHEFSGGMRQRVMIAMALACDPVVLLADEPTTALDVTIQAQILDLMRELKSRISTSIIMITHDLGIVSDLCDRVHVMYGGQLMETGTIDDLFYRTAHPYTKGLLNCLPQTAVTKGLRRLEPIGGTPLDLMMPPEGCMFASRCAKCMKLCLKRGAELIPVGTGHHSRCWLSALEKGVA